MIKINLDPNLVELGPLVIAWHGVFTAVGILLGAWIAARVIRGFGHSDDVVYNGLVWAVSGGVIGARVLYVVGNWSLFEENPLRLFAINEGGISVWGAVVGGIVGGTLYFLRNRRNTTATLGQFADACAAALLLGMIFGRLGDVVNGEHWGTESNAPWSVAYTHPQTLAERGVSVHSAVTYEMIWNAGVLLLCLWLIRRTRVRGVAFWLFLVLYAIGRLWTHEFRKDNAVVWGLHEAQVISLVILAVSLPALLWVWRRGVSRTEFVPPSGSQHRPAEEVGQPELAGGDGRS